MNVSKFIVGLLIASISFVSFAQDDGSDAAPADKTQYRKHGMKARQARRDDRRKERREERRQRYKTRYTKTKTIWRLSVYSSRYDSINMKVA